MGGGVGGKQVTCDPDTKLNPMYKKIFLTDTNGLIPINFIWGQYRLWDVNDKYKQRSLFTQ